ncbi:MAG: hypothetical protein JWP30_1937 [Homoserinimonas sp.]|nr:hypothetical protein [Homoserinimonas sp.]
MAKLAAVCLTLCRVRPSWPIISAASSNPTVTERSPPQPASSGCRERRRAGLLAFDVRFEFGEQGRGNRNGSRFVAFGLRVELHAVDFDDRVLRLEAPACEVDVLDAKTGCLAPPRYARAPALLQRTGHRLIAVPGLGPNAIEIAERIAAAVRAENRDESVRAFLDYADRLAHTGRRTRNPEWSPARLVRPPGTPLLPLFPTTG